ncbi:MAG: heparinase II/III family protein [Thermoguttaceae bacterium]|jgi:hypothetical protein
MPHGPTRREFLKTAGAAGSLLVLAPDRVEAAAGPSGGSPLDRGAVEAELRRRATQHLGQRRLVVDYYRIGRKLAYPLPVPGLCVPEVAVPGLADYPWTIWMLWALEERILSLGWAAEWFHDPLAARAAGADLEALAHWPEYRQYPKPDLSSAHAGRILFNAATRWHWPDESLRRSLCEACRRHTESVLGASDKFFGAVEDKNDILRRQSPHELLANIPVIGTIGAALTAAVAGHPAAARLSARVRSLFAATLDLRARGFTEAVAYDGYVLDFIADWLGTLGAGDRAPIVEHPRFDEYLEESYMLGAPGAAGNLAELSDVEPREMPFHLSAQAKLLALRPHPLRSWLLGRSPLELSRTDALAALRRAEAVPAAAAPRPGALEAHYAAVLRSGWEAEDLAVAVSRSTSPMEHLQRDSGTLVLGTRGQWFIADPGYQQYAPGDERDFTFGPTAHNAPLVNGQAVAEKRPRRLRLEEVGPGLWRLGVDLTACYPPAAALQRCVRHVWLSGRDLVVVADQVEARRPPQLKYHWHGNRAAAWWFEEGWAMLLVEGTPLWFTAAHLRLSGTHLHRLPGSRGQLTLVAAIESAPSVAWWAFAVGPVRPVMSLSADGRELIVRDRRFGV